MFVCVCNFDLGLLVCWMVWFIGLVLCGVCAYWIFGNGCIVVTFDYVWLQLFVVLACCSL